MTILLLMEDLTELDILPRGVDRVIEVEGRFLRSQTDMDLLRVHDILTYDQLYSLNRQARDIAAQWYIAGGADLTHNEEAGVSAGDCLRFKIGVSISRLLRHVTLLRKLSEGSCRSRILIHGEVPACLRDFITDWSIPVTILPRKKEQSNAAHRKVLHKTRELLYPLKKKAYSYFMKTGRPSEQGSITSKTISHGGNVRIFAPPDVASSAFVHTVASRLKAEVYERVPVEFRNNGKRQNSCKKALYREYLERTKRIVDTEAYKQLCMKEGSWFMRTLNRWIWEALPPAGASFINDSILFEQFLRVQEITLLMMPMAWGGKDRAYIHTAQKNGVPVIIIQDGILQEHFALSLPPVVADYAFVLGESGRRWFEQSGISSDSILQVGPLLWSDNGIEPAGRGQEKRSSKTRNVLYLAPRPGDFGADHSGFEAYEQIELVCETLSSYPDLQVTIKFHPRWKDYPGLEKRRELENRIRDLLKREITTLDDGEDVMSAIDRADIVICYPSTTVIHALRLRKPVIAVDFSGRGIEYGAKGNFSGTTYTPNELSGAINEIIEKKSTFVDRWRPTLEEHLSRGLNISEVADYIKNITLSKGLTVK